MSAARADVRSITLFRIIQFEVRNVFMNRISDGFGVVPESWKVESYERHMREVVATTEAIKPVRMIQAKPEHRSPPR